MADDHYSSKRKYDDPSPPPRRTGFSSGPPPASPPAGGAPSYNSVPPPPDEIQLAKQRAQEIAARIFNAAEAKRPRVDNGDDDVGGFGGGGSLGGSGGGGRIGGGGLGFSSSAGGGELQDLLVVDPMLGRVDLFVCAWWWRTRLLVHKDWGVFFARFTIRFGVWIDRSMCVSCGCSNLVHV